MDLIYLKVMVGNFSDLIVDARLQNLATAARTILYRQSMNESKSFVTSIRKVGSSLAVLKFAKETCFLFKFGIIWVIGM